MEWIDKFDLFLFDFDGLLVNSEELHFLAYQKMCKARGYELKWDLAQFFRAAHFKATGLQEAIYAAFPDLHIEEPEWSVLYKEKKEAYQQLLEAGEINLMPGVEELLKALAEREVARCVVTNSLYEQVEVIKAQHATLRSIPVWITREDYKEAKPAPDGYLEAIKRLGTPKGKSIGFEDSTRGLQALLAAHVTQPVLISPAHHPQMATPLPSSVLHFHSLADVCL